MARQVNRRANHNVYLYFLVTALVLSCLSGGYLLYSQNIFGIRGQQARATQIRRVVPLTHKRRTVLNYERIRHQVMRPTHHKEGLSKQGFVSIPAVGILLPIFNQAYSRAGLAAGADYIAVKDQTPTMGQGNYALAAHNYDDGRTGFSPLQQYLNKNEPYLVDGKAQEDHWLDQQFIYLANDSGIYAYQIVKQFIVGMDNVHVLEDSEKPTVMIITCLYPNDFYRIVTVGNIKATYTWQNVPDTILNYFDLQVQSTNAYGKQNPGIEEGTNGNAGGQNRSM